MNEELLKVVIILGIVFLIIAIITFCYLIIALRKMHIVTKKVDYFVEDLTYKSEKLNTTVDAIVKLSEYIDVFETYAKKNISLIKEKQLEQQRSEQEQQGV